MSSHVRRPAEADAGVIEERQPATDNWLTSRCEKRAPEKRAVLVGAFDHNAEARRLALSSRPIEVSQGDCQRRDSMSLASLVVQNM
jgi:hypothetical protein